MHQLLQHIKNGRTAVDAVPEPAVQPAHVLIANAASVVSAGTEKMAMDLARKSLLGKARERPDQVRRVAEKVRQEGLASAVRAVRARLDVPMAMGYASAGVVVQVGPGVQEFKPGDRVASNGPHAGVVCVPKNLCARVPDEVPFEQAAFAVLGAIAMQGVRLAKVALGETALVVGLGLVGQLTVATLKAAGCRVIGVDPDIAKCRLAEVMGADLVRPKLRASDVERWTRGLGADVVIITASTRSNGPIQLAADAVRQKGRVVLVGVVGLQLDRRPFYFKECEFAVSCSYGPGRYDPVYEELGHDYPAAYVRWTEQRNMQAVLDLMAGGQLDVSPLITHRFPIEEAGQAYALIEKGNEPYVGIVLEYRNSRESRVEGLAPEKSLKPENGQGSRVESLTAGNAQARALERGIERNGKGPSIGVGVLGAGNFARMVMLPAIRKDAVLRPVIACSARGMSANHAADKFGFATATTDEDEVFADERVGVVFALTRHHDHARQVVKAIHAGKHVFVEKPLCLTREELEEIEGELAAAGNAAPIVMVGFNRRFSPAVGYVKEFFGAGGTAGNHANGEMRGTVSRRLFAGRKKRPLRLFTTPKRPLTKGKNGGGMVPPVTVSIRFNAGAITADHWTQMDSIGGGRILGEACHAIDLATFLTGSLPVRVFAESVGGANAPAITDDQCFMTLRHANGSISQIGYLAGGDRAFAKERIEVLGGGRVAVIDDFRRVTTCEGGKTRQKNFRGQDKGHRAEVAALARCIAHGCAAPIAWNELRAVTLAAVLAVQSLRDGNPHWVPGGS